MKKIVILISGRGSNMAAIIEASKTGRLAATIDAVISNRHDAAGLATAASAGIATIVVEPAQHADREAFDAALAGAIDARRPDCIVLAGFMRVLSEAFVARYSDRLLNIHPSLLPAFPGLHTHRRALEAGVRAHGATVHFVSPIVDAGPIIAQAVVPVRHDDDEQALAARVLATEHRLYPRAIDWFLSGDATLVDGRVRTSAAVAGETLMVAA